MSESSEKEIEVTPEMIEAGYQVLLDAGLGDALLKADKYTVAEIFRAMAVLMPRGNQRCE